MDSGSGKDTKTCITFLVGGFGAGKSKFYKQEKSRLFAEYQKAGWDFVGNKVVKALNKPPLERSAKQVKLLYDICHLQEFMEQNNIRINKPIESGSTKSASERMNELLSKAPAIKRTDVRNALRPEIAAYDGLCIALSVRAGKNVMVDTTGRPDIRLGVYNILKKNELFDGCRFESYNLEAPTAEKIAKTAAMRLIRPKERTLYTSDSLEEIYPQLYPPPMVGTATGKTLNECKTLEDTLFKQGRMRAFFVPQFREAGTEYPEILYNDAERISHQHAKVCHLPDSTLLPDEISILSTLKLKPAERSSA
jgi:hypothetical protein